MVHISEFTADLIKNGKIKLDKTRNSHIVQPSMILATRQGHGAFGRTRYILDHVVEKWYEMPENNFIRERTFCCGSGTALNTDEIMELRMRSGLPRANAVKYVHEKHGVNTPRPAPLTAPHCLP